MVAKKNVEVEMDYPANMLDRRIRDIGQRINTGMPLSVIAFRFGIPANVLSPFYTAEGPFSKDEIMKVDKTVELGGDRTEIFIRFREFSGQKQVRYVPMSHFLTGHDALVAEPLQNYLISYADLNDLPAVKALLEAGVNLTESWMFGVPQPPLLVTARESLASSSGKRFPDEISKLIVEEAERRTLRRRAALLSIRPPSTRRGRRAQTRKRR